MERVHSCNPGARTGQLELYLMVSAECLQSYQKAVSVAIRSRHHRHGPAPFPSCVPAPADDDSNTAHRSLDRTHGSGVSAPSRQTAPHTWHSAGNGTHAHSRHSVGQQIYIQHAARTNKHPGEIYILCTKAAPNRGLNINSCYNYWAKCEKFHK